MKYSMSLAALAAAGMVSGSPVVKRSTDIDAIILNYALTLEHLEDKFYREGLANYTEADFASAGFDKTFYTNVQEVSYDETTHVSFLTTALTGAGFAATAECTYNFPSTDPKSFVALASVLEGVGVSAYLGAAANITNGDYLTAAGSILTVESRHSAYLRSALNESPYPQPFDNPLDFDEVYSLAAAFIVSCPSTNPPLPVKAFAPLALGTSGAVKSGDVIDVLTPNYSLVAVDGKAPIYAAFITVTGPLISEATPIEGGFKVTVPKGINGQSYLVLTSCSDRVTDDYIKAGPLIVEITNPYPTTA